MISTIERDSRNLWAPVKPHQLSHPRFAIQDAYVLAPETLSRREKAEVFFHTRTCGWCRSAQKALRINPEQMLECWDATDPRTSQLPLAAE